MRPVYKAGAVANVEGFQTIGLQTNLRVYLIVVNNLPLFQVFLLITAAKM